MNYEEKLLTRLRERKPIYEWSIEDVEVKEETKRVVVASYKKKESGMVLPSNPEWKSIKVVVDTIIGNANEELLTKDEWEAMEPVSHVVEEVVDAKD